MEQSEQRGEGEEGRDARARCGEHGEESKGALSIEHPLTPALVTQEARSGSVHTTRKMSGPHPSNRSRKEGINTAGHTLKHRRAQNTEHSLR